jgi:hypothetical protein
MEYLRAIEEKSRSAAAPSVFLTIESRPAALTAFSVRNATAQETALLRRSRARCAGESAARLAARGGKRKAISMLSEAQRLVEQCGLEGVAGARLAELRKQAAAHRAEQARAEKAAVDDARCRVAGLEAQLRVELEATNAAVSVPAEAAEVQAMPLAPSGAEADLVALQRERAAVAVAQRAVDAEVEQLAAAAAATAAAALAAPLPLETTAPAATAPLPTLLLKPAASGAGESDAVRGDGAAALVAAEAEAEGAEAEGAEAEGAEAAEAAAEAEPYAALVQSDAELAAAHAALETERATACDAEAAVAAQRARADALKEAALRAISASAADGDATAAALQVVAVECGGVAPLEELKQRVGLTTIFKLVGTSLLRIDRAASPSSVHAAFM